MGLFKQNIYKKVIKQIKKYDTIIIARHVGPDPDALGSSLGLKQIIMDNFKGKDVYCIGASAARFNYLGSLDKIPDDIDNSKVLLIVTDTPDHRRVDGVDPRNFPNSIKIDHHPFIEKTCLLEWIDDKASSASQMILELVFKMNLKLTKEAALKLYTGVVADTNRFMFAYSSYKTFELVSRMLKETKIDITSVYNNLYLRDFKEIRFSGYMSLNYKITNNKVGFIIIKDNELKEYNVDAATPGNLINGFNYINDMLVWVTATEDIELGSFRISIRSRGPVINQVAASFGGGGHIYASGVRLRKEEEILNLVDSLDKVCKEYISNLDN